MDSSMRATNVAAAAGMFRQLSKEIMFGAYRARRNVDQKVFRAFLGMSAEVCALVWLRISSRLPPYGRPVHLLWALLLLKVYATESVNRALTGVDEKPFRKWAWTFIELIADMRVVRFYGQIQFLLQNINLTLLSATLKISWEKLCVDRRSVAMVSVDGSDFRIYEPFPFNPKWYSHKFHGPGLRYEVGVAVSTCHIVWVNGPFPCGSHPDNKIFQKSMKKALDVGEFVIADGGYSDERCRRIAENDILTKLYSTLRARHETVNRRMKHFNVLLNCFRQHRSLHSSCFHAVANVTQLMIETSDPLFTIFK